MTDVMEQRGEHEPVGLAGGAGTGRCLERVVEHVDPLAVGVLGHRLRRGRGGGRRSAGCAPTSELPVQSAAASTPARSATVGAMSRIDALVHIEAGAMRAERTTTNVSRMSLDRLEVPRSHAAVIGRDDDRRARTGGLHEIGEQSVDARRRREVLVASPSDRVTGEVGADEVGERDVGSVAPQHIDRLAGDDIVVVRVVAAVETDAVLRGVRLDQ